MLATYFFRSSRSFSSYLYPEPVVALFNSSGFLSIFPRTKALAFFQAGINFSLNSLAVASLSFD